MRPRPSASAGAIFFVAGSVTVCAFACTHDLSPYESGRRDTGAGVDTAIDAGDEVVILDTDAMNTEAETDTGPGPFDLPCTAAGPSEATCIPGGSFTMGSSNTNACPPSGCASEMPEKRVSVTRFHIDNHEVSVGKFRAWWNSPGRTWPAANAIFYSTSKDLRWRTTWPTAPTEPAMSPGCFWKGAADDTNDDKPLNCITWWTALAFCMSDGRRLPTEAEFEYVASGGENRLFPWSAKETENDSVDPSSVTCVHALLSPMCAPATAPRESTIWGRARWAQPPVSGVWNLAGSVSEWMLDGPLADHSSIVPDTADPVTDPGTNSNRTIRGGGYQPASIYDLRTTWRRTGILATETDAQIGFRCAKSAP